MTSKMLCRMCLIDADDIMQIFTDKIPHSKIAAVIARHFWFEVKIDDPISNMLCVACWREIKSFHNYYQTIEVAQRKLSERIPVKEEPNTPHVDPDVETLLKVEHDTAELDSLGKELNDREVSTYDEPCNKFEELFVPGATENVTTETIDQIETVNEEIQKIEVFSDSDSEPLIFRIRKRKQLKREEEEEYSPSDSSDSDDNSYEAVVPRKQRGRPKKSPGEKTATAKKKKIRKVDPERAQKYAEYQKKFEQDEEKIRDTLQLKCDLCGDNNIKCFADVKRHYREAHQSRGYILCCNKKLYKRALLLDHVNLHLDPEHFKCQQCNKTYVDKQGLKNHMFRHEADESNAHKCKHCSRLFAKPYLLSKHLLIHAPMEERQNFCEDCGKGFPSKSQKDIHQRYVHHKSAGQMCHICAKVIRDKKLFAKHQMKHAGIMPTKVQCKVCGAWLFQENMRKHMKLHNEYAGEHVCSICGKVCPSKVAMRSHIRYAHSEQPTFSCSVCERSFKKAVNLKEHMTTHTGEVLYTCPHCPKTFNSNANMHSHRKKMHPKEWAEGRRYRGIPQPGFSQPTSSGGDGVNVTESGVGESILAQSDDSGMHVMYDNFGSQHDLV